MAVLKLAIFFAICVSMTEGLSFLKKQNMNTFQVHAIASGKKYTGHELTGKTCVDSVTGDKCKSLRLYCGSSEYVKEGCRKTCGFCQSYPPPCANSALGCCWDNVTAVENGKQCPACEDVNTDCKVMKVNCHDDLTRRLCPLTCGVNCELCMDDQHQAEHCPGFRQFGICKSDPDLMQEYCKKTCGFC